MEKSFALGAKNVNIFSVFFILKIGFFLKLDSLRMLGFFILPDKVVKPRNAFKSIVFSEHNGGRPYPSIGVGKVFTWWKDASVEGDCKAPCCCLHPHHLHHLQ